MQQYKFEKNKCKENRKKLEYFCETQIIFLIDVHDLESM